MSEPLPTHGERRRPTKGDRRRQAILDALEQQLRERSIAELTVDDIAAAAGITRPGFYFYFDSKYAALTAAIAGVWSEMAQAAAPFFEGAGTPTATGRRQLADTAALWRRHEPLLVGIVEAAATDEYARDLWDRVMEGSIDDVANRIEQERAAGRAPAGPPDARALATVLMSMNERALYRDRRRKASRAETARTVDALTRVWVTAIYGDREVESGPQ